MSTRNSGPKSNIQRTGSIWLGRSDREGNVRERESEAFGALLDGQCMSGVWLRWNWRVGRAKIEATTGGVVRIVHHRRLRLREGVCQRLGRRLLVGVIERKQNRLVASPTATTTPSPFATKFFPLIESSRLYNGIPGHTRKISQSIQRSPLKSPTVHRSSLPLSLRLDSSLANPPRPHPPVSVGPWESRPQFTLGQPL